MKIRILISRTAIVSLLFMVFSCASFKTIFREPEVSFDSASISSINFNSVDFIFRYAVDNPNAVSLEMAGFKYDLFVEGHKFLSGTSPSPVSIAKESKSLVDIPVGIVYRDLYLLLTELHKLDSAEYRIEAEFTFELPVFGKAVFPIEYSGVLPLPKVPDIAFDKLKIVSLSPFSAALELSLNIINRNSFAISPDSFNFNLSVNGSQWLRGIMKNIPEMAPGKSASVKIPVEINPAKIGEELFRLIFNGESLGLVLDGNMDIRTSYPGLPEAVIPFRIEKKTAAAK